MKRPCKLWISLLTSYVTAMWLSPVSAAGEKGFNELPPVLGDLPDNDGVKTVRPADKFCDLNRDGKCDEADAELMGKALGSCRGDPAYSVLRDVNMDGCVTLGDGRVTFQSSLDGQKAWWDELIAKVQACSPQGKVAAPNIAEETVHMAELYFGPVHPNVVIALEHAATCLRKLGKVDEAETMEARAKSIGSAQSSPVQ